MLELASAQLMNAQPFSLFFSGTINTGGAKTGGRSENGGRSGNGIGAKEGSEPVGRFVCICACAWLR